MIFERHQKTHPPPHPELSGNHSLEKPRLGFKLLYLGKEQIGGTGWKVTNVNKTLLLRRSTKDGLKKNLQIFKTGTKLHKARGSAGEHPNAKSRLKAKKPKGLKPARAKSVPAPSQRHKYSIISDLLRLIKPLIKPAVVFSIVCYFLFPITAYSLGLAFGALILSGILYYRLKFEKSASKKHFLIRCIILAVCFYAILAIFSPLLLARKPLYLAVSPGFHPSDCELVTLRNADAAVGSFMLVSDPARSYICTRLARLFGNNIRLLRVEEYGNKNYVIMPIVSKYIVDAREESQIGRKRSLWLPIDGLGEYIDIRYSSSITNISDLPSGSGMSVGARTVHDSLIDFAYLESPETVPWNAIAVKDNVDLAAFQYCSCLDLAIEASIKGQYGDSLSILRSISSSWPRSNLEGTRLIALQCRLTSAMLAGSIGRLQTIPLLHKAEHLFLQSTNDSRFSARDPLTIWLAETLKERYETFSPLFDSHLEALAKMGIPQEDTVSYFDALDDRLESLGPDRIYTQVTNGLLSPLEIIKAYETLSGIDSQALLAEYISSLQNGPRPEATENHLKAIFNHQRTLIPIIRKAMGDSNHVLYLNHWDAFLSYMQDFYHLGTNSNLTQGQDDMDMLAKMKTAGIPTSPAMLHSVTAREWQMSRQESDCEWWKDTYLSWFITWASAAGNEIHNHRTNITTTFNVSPVFVELLSKRQTECFIYDHGGSGEVFLPGVFLMALHNQLAGYPDLDALKNLFEQQTQIPFDRAATVLPDIGTNIVVSKKDSNTEFYLDFVSRHH